MILKHQLPKSPMSKYGPGEVKIINLSLICIFLSSIGLRVSTWTHETILSFFGKKVAQLQNRLLVFCSYGGWQPDGRPTAIGRLPVKNKSTYRWSTLQPNIKVDTSLNVNLQDLTNGGVGKLVPSLQDDLNNIIWSFFIVGRPADGRPSNHKNHYIMLSKSSCNDCTNFPTSPLVRKCRFTFNEVSIMMFGWSVDQRCVFLFQNWRFMVGQPAGHRPAAQP